MHHAQRQRHIRAGADRDVPVGQGRSARAIGVDRDEPRPVAPGFFNKRPQMNVVAVDVRAPRKNQLRQPEILGGRAELLPVHQVPRLSARFGTNRAVELARAQAMKKAPVHRPVAQHADGPRVAIGQDRLGTVAIGNLAEPRGNRVQRLVPAHAVKDFELIPAGPRTLGRARFPLQRIENAVRRVDTIQILGHLAAQESPRHRLPGIALDLDRAALRVHRHQHRARVGAIVRADGVNDTELRGSSHAVILSQQPNATAFAFGVTKRNSGRV